MAPRQISYEEVIDCDVADRREAINQQIKTLSYREREVIKLRFGLGGGTTYTLEEVGKFFALSKERIAQIERKAIRKLGETCRKSSLEPFT
jgi:RNA polymerase primary sigma factor